MSSGHLPVGIQETVCMTKFIPVSATLDDFQIKIRKYRLTVKFVPSFCKSELVSIFILSRLSCEGIFLHIIFGPTVTYKALHVFQILLKISIKDS